jgi:RHS repeat-associated protein
LLKAVSRINSHGELLYRHTYDEYDKEGRLLRETHLSSVEYGYDSLGRPAYRKDAYLSEDYFFDCEGNLSKRGNKCYSYDGKAQLVAEEPEGFVAEYDDRFNCIKLNDQWVTSKSQVHAADTFDGFGRRLTHGCESFLFVGNEEIASCENGKLKEVRILGGFRRAIGIEIDSVAYVPIHDIQGTIRYLVDWKTGAVRERNNCDAFGRGVNPKIPYAYLGKRYDVDTDLFYFGKRFYDPFMASWTSSDPLGPMQCDNLYQYVFNNPFRYIDPYGESVWGFLGGLGEIVLGGTLCITGGVLEVASLGTYTIGFGFQEAAGMALITDGLGRSIYHSQDLAKSRTIKEQKSPKDKSSSKNDQDNSSSIEKNPKQNPGNLQKQVEQKKAPKSVDRVDRGRGDFEKDHIHFDNGSALNYDGTWKHGEKLLTNEEIQWILKNGWSVPK